MLCPANLLGAISPSERLHGRRLQAYNPGTRMPEEVFLPRRHSVRLPTFDYSSPTAYFVTVCTQNKRRIFGTISGHTVALNVVGKVVESCWLQIPSHFARVELGPHVIMPNHLHGIIRLLPPEADGGLVAKHPRRAQHAVPLRPEPARSFAEMAANSIPAIVRSFKSAATAAIRTSLGRPGLSVWQRGYHEHVIRDEDDFRNTCEYIRMNPARWEFDQENS
jgi:REP-associated tyrosine transposase